MAKLKSYPTSESDFHGEINIDIPYLNTAANKARLVTTPTATDALTKAVTLLTQFNTDYQQSFNESTVNDTLKSALKKNLEQLEKYALTILGDIPASVFTVIDKKTLKIEEKESTTRSPAKKPKHTPFVMVSSYKHLLLTIFVGDTDAPDKRAKPEGVNGIEIEIAFFAPTATIPTGVIPNNMFNHWVTSGRTKTVLEFPAEYAKYTIYIRARYINTRKETSAWSSPISTSIV